MTTERIKEELQWLRTAFQVIAAFDAGLVAYAVQTTTTHPMALIASAAAVIGALLLFAVIANVYRFLRELE